MLPVTSHIIYESVLDDLSSIKSFNLPITQDTHDLESLTRFRELIVVTAANIHNPDTSQLEQFLESRTDDWQILHINSSDNSVSDFEAFMNFIDIDYDTQDGNILIIGFHLPTHSRVRFCIQLGGNLWKITRDLENCRISLIKNSREYPRILQRDNKFHTWTHISDFPQYARNYILDHNYDNPNFRKDIMDIICISYYGDSAANSSQRAFDIRSEIESYLKKHKTLLNESILDDYQPSDQDVSRVISDTSPIDTVLPEPGAWMFALFFEIKNDENPQGIEKIRHILDTYAEKYNIYTIDTPESAKAIEMTMINIVAIQKGQIERNSVHYIIEFDCHRRPYIPIFYLMSIGKSGILVPKKMIYHNTLFYDYAKSLEYLRVQRMLAGEFADENEIIKSISYVLKKGGVKEYLSRIKKFVRKFQNRSQK